MLTLIALTSLLFSPASGSRVADNKAEVQKRIDREYSSLEKLYIQIHTHPELSLKEEQTAALLAKEMRAAGFEVTEKVGGFGLVCMLRNGPGPTVLIRTDMDALPVEEKTGLPYASTARGKDREGKDMPIMHACGHDAHMACWIGTARALADMKDRWHGTLMFIAQPAEEIGMGARLMIQDGLFKRFPKPDYALALHCSAIAPHGSITYTEGPAMANVDSVDIIVKGRGGHGSAPHTTVDPIVLAARIILDLQTLVSREKDPLEPAVVTVGSIHGGLKHNIIPSEVTMLLTIRSYKDSVRKQILEGIERIAKAAALSAKAPEPEVKIREDEFTPATVNDPDLTRKTVAVLKAALGEDKLLAFPPTMGGEDFSRYGREGVPIFMFNVGTQPSDKVAESKRPNGKPLPSLHSDLFFPIPEPTIKTGVLAMSLAVLNLTRK